MLRERSRSAEVLHLWTNTVFYAMISATVVLFVGRLILDRQWMNEMIGAIWFCIAIAAIAVAVMHLIDMVDHKQQARPPRR